MATAFSIRDDRRASEAFLKRFLSHAVLSRLRETAAAGSGSARPSDAQDPEDRRVVGDPVRGVTSVLDVHDAKDRLRLAAHRT